MKLLLTQSDCVKSFANHILDIDAISLTYVITRWQKSQIASLYCFNRSHNSKSAFFISVELIS